MDIQFIFLLDEAKRILSTRFPRGFQDNLFALMFGSASGPYSFVLSGAQELYKLCEDSTSPIGSRAAKHLVCNLSFEGVDQIIRWYQRDGDDRVLEERARLTYDHTGGHAGLSAALAKRLAELPTTPVESLAMVVGSFSGERSELFQIWTHGLSSEARILGETLAETRRMTSQDMARCMRSNGFEPYRSTRASEELQFTGIATIEGGDLVSTNLMYNAVARSYNVADRGTDSEEEVWALVGESETGLRRLIRAEFEKKWQTSADSKIKGILGEKAWARLVELRGKAEKSYRRTDRPVTEILDCAHLGQLGDLIKHNSSWALFQGMFRDKRELEDLLGGILPVRNDCAHFRKVPDNELLRCKLNCEDLLAIIEKRSGSL
jgi:hypothetical protein